MQSHHACFHNKTNKAFSLLEAIIAVAIATLILVLAASSIRAASQSMRAIQRISDENQLLQIGWFAAMRDADYWLSHASPDFPYLARPQSEEVSVGGTTDHPWDKRPFRPVTFEDERNPFQLLPHQPHTWYRGDIITSVTPMMRVPPSYRAVYTLAYASDSIASYQSKPNDLENEVPHMPAGWAPWHISGDYASLSSAFDMSTNGGGTSEFTDRGHPVYDLQPSLQWWLFGELGHIGATAYMPAGTVNLISRPTDNRDTGNIGDRSRWYDWGELPWMLATGSVSAGGAIDPSGFSPDNFLVPSSLDVPVSNVRRLNTVVGLPVSGGDNNAFTFSDSGSVQIREARYTNARSGLNTGYASDLRTAASSFQLRFGSSGVRTPNAMFYPTQAIRVGSDWDTYALLDATAEMPFRRLMDDDAGFVGSRHAQRMRQRYTLRTQHQPAVATGDDRRPAGIENMLQMNTSIVRYYSNYADRNRISIRVFNPDTSASIEVTTSVLSTNFIGARQHWGWVSAERADLSPMGDN